jgi:hypothetical protein
MFDLPGKPGVSPFHWPGFSPAKLLFMKTAADFAKLPNADFT